MTSDNNMNMGQIFTEIITANLGGGDEISSSENATQIFDDLMCTDNNINNNNNGESTIIYDKSDFASTTVINSNNNQIIDSKSQSNNISSCYHVNIHETNMFKNNNNNNDNLITIDDDDNNISINSKDDENVANNNSNKGASLLNNNNEDFIFISDDEVSNNNNGNNNQVSSKITIDDNNNNSYSNITITNDNENDNNVSSINFNTFANANNNNFLNNSFCSNTNDNSSFLMSPPLSSAIRPIPLATSTPKHIPTFNNPMLNVVTPPHYNNPNNNNNNSRPSQKPPTQEQLDNREVQVEKIVTRKFVEGKIFYRIQWQGYPSKCNTWLSSDRLWRYKDILEDHDRRNRKLTEVLISCSAEPLKPNPVDRHSFINGNLRPTPRPLKKIKMESPELGGWDSYNNSNSSSNSAINISSTSGDPNNAHNYCQPGNQRVLPIPIPIEHPRTSFSGIKQDLSLKSPSKSLYTSFTKYDDEINISNYYQQLGETDRINGARKTITSASRVVNNANNIIKTPSQSPRPVPLPRPLAPMPIPRVKKILPSLKAHRPPTPPVLNSPLVTLMPMPQSDQYHILFPISAVDFTHEGTMTVFNIQFLQCLNSLQLKFQRRSVLTLTQNNKQLNKTSSSPLSTVPVGALGNGNLNLKSSTAITTPPASPISSSSSSPSSSSKILDSEESSQSKSVANSNSPDLGASAVPKLHLLDPLITIQELLCKNGSEVIVRATLEKEKQCKYFAVNDVFKTYPEYLYCFVLNETMRFRPNCDNLT